ncbi:MULTISPECIES: gas vesicle accessory protein GvpU [unclassified Fictibacillus]|uniref:gas vesicle accessory protein GvpU n=1 Tax=unclassified Fictibacillus TaxID=2644029 RepID=UPI0007840349|nr:MULTISPECIES: gas vesicle accessory protein GvpU [unclassified Fictibacillus]MED2974942.1 gas vesicle protein GvpU [Fictibacillus sp. B-59209]
MSSTTSSQSKDSILEFFVKACNKHGFSLDITLNVKGAVITGTTITAQEYFETLAETFEDGNEIAQEIGERLVKAGEAAEDDNNNSDINFIHLKNTRVFCGDSNSTPSKGKILWRGKLDQVDGFFLGRISDSKS